jgi:hypothetical protein
MRRLRATAICHRSGIRGTPWASLRISASVSEQPMMRSSSAHRRAARAQKRLDGEDEPSHAT